VQDALISPGGKKKQLQGEIDCHNNTDSNKNPLKTTPKIKEQTPGLEEVADSSCTDTAEAATLPT